MTAGLQAVVFLDFDGVLHPRNAASSVEMFRGLLFLDEALGDSEDVGIVITSTWRHYPQDLAEAIGRFPARLSRQILGSTPVQGGKVAREDEISGWLNSASIAPAKALILDDEPELFKLLFDQLLVVDGAVGLTGKDVSAIRIALVGCRQA